MENSPKSTRVQRSESEIRTILKEQETSNVTVKDFCEIFEIHEATFYNWRNKYGPKVDKSGEFIEMEIGEISQESSLFAEIEISGKIIVRRDRKNQYASH